MQKTSIGALLLALCAAFPSVSTAKLIEIQFTGLDFKYDGVDLFDGGGKAGGSGKASESDPLTTMTFLTDSTLVGVLTKDIYADFLLKNVTEIPVSGGLVMENGTSGFGFDLLVSSQDGGWGIGLDVEKYQVFYSGNKLSIAATEVASNLRTQNLPFGLVINPGDEIKIIISSANMADVTDNGTFLTGFKASGTGNIRGSDVPEPSAAGLCLLAGVGLFQAVRRRVA